MRLLMITAVAWVMLVGLALAFLCGQPSLRIETVRNMSYRHGDHEVPLRRLAGTTALFYQSKLSCDVDGAPNAYHPDDDDLALDLIESAGGVREGDRHDGRLLVQPSPYIVVWQNNKPYIQPAGEFKGFYVSESALQNLSLPATDPGRYLDATRTQYIVLPGDMVPEATLGDLAVVYDPAAKTVAAAVYGDIGPTNESGEASLATIQRIGMATTSGKSSPGQFRDDIFFMVFPGTHKRLENSEKWPYRKEAIDSFAFDELRKWGGVERIETVIKQDPKGGPVPNTLANRFVYDELGSLSKAGLIKVNEYSLPGDASRRLPCATEIVMAAKAGTDSIEIGLKAVERCEQPVKTLNGYSDHLRQIENIFRRFAKQTAAVLDGTIRETARCDALRSRVQRCLRPLTKSRSR